MKDNQSVFKNQLATTIGKKAVDIQGESDDKEQQIKSKRGYMTIATKKEIEIIDIICEQGMNTKKHVRIAEMIIRRQARRQNKLLTLRKIEQ